MGRTFFIFLLMYAPFSYRNDSNYSQKIKRIICRPLDGALYRVGGDDDGLCGGEGNVATSILSGVATI